MKIIRKYVLTSYMKPFFKGLAAFLLLMIITHFFDYLHSFLDKKPPLDILIVYFANRLPEWLVTITPVATLLAVLFSLGTLNRNHEITAIESSGIKLSFIIKPLIMFSVVISLTCGLIYEAIVPVTTARAEELFLVIRDRKPRARDAVRKDFTYMGHQKRLYRIDKFEGNTIDGLKLIEFFPGSLKENRHISADKAVYIDGKWKLMNVVVREFSARDGQILSYDTYGHKFLDLEETPQDFSKPEKAPEQMDFITLLNYVKKLQSGGFSNVRERVILHNKVSFPFSNTIILILGIPIALWSGMKSRTAGFFLSLVICFIYWGAISVGRAMGTSGMISPFMGAWAANIVFFIISIVMMKVARVI